MGLPSKDTLSFLLQSISENANSKSRCQGDKDNSEFAIAHLVTPVAAGQIFAEMAAALCRGELFTQDSEIRV